MTVSSDSEYASEYAYRRPTRLLCQVHSPLSRFPTVTEQPESFSGLAGLFVIEQPDWLSKDCIILCGLEMVKPSISNLKRSTGTFSNLERSHQPEKVTRNLLGSDFVYYTLFGHEMFA